jgi:sugar phosphate isomerase/epimerase
MAKSSIGLQMYTLRNFCKTPEYISETLKKVGKMGYEVVQLSGMAPMDPKELKKILDDNGLHACSTHTGYTKIVENTDEVIEEHKILGCEAIMCPGLPRELHNKEGYLKAAEEFAKVLPKIKESGLLVGYHNHGTEFERYDGEVGLEMLLENCSELHAEIDTYWVQYGGGDPAFWIEKYSGRVSQIHFKDMGIVKKSQTMPPIGDGNLNWERILEASKRAGVEYYLVEMDHPTIDPFQASRVSLEHMKKWGLE